MQKVVCLTADIFGNVYLMGGTNDDVSNFTYYHVRSNNKLFKLNSDNTFTEIGVNLLKDVNKFIFQFHAAPRYGEIKKLNLLGSRYSKLSIMLIMML